MDENVKMFLDKVQGLNEKKLSVWVKSLSTRIPCSPLTFPQQKDLISTIADGTVGALKFQKYLNSIVTDNTGVDIRVTDRVGVILSLRCDSLGNTIKIDNEEVPLSPCLDKFDKSSIRIDEKIDDKDNGMVVELTVPTLRSENEVITATIQLLKREGETDIGQNIGHIYTYEIVKYIKSIKIGELELVFSDIPIKDRVKIVENVPVSVNKRIVEFIQKIKKQEQEILTVLVNGEEKTFDIDVSFFDS